MKDDDIVMQLEGDCGEPIYVYWREVAALLEPPVLAEVFAQYDSVAQEQMLANLHLLCPYLNIEWKKA